MELIHDTAEMKKNSTVDLKQTTWDQLDKIAELETKKRKAANLRGKVSRNRIIQNFLDYAIAEYFRELAKEEALLSDRPKKVSR